MPAGAGADRPPAGRLAGHLVAGRGRRAAPAGPDPARRDGRLAAALARARRHADRRATLARGPRRAGRRHRPRARRRPPGRWARSSSGEATPAQIAGFAVALRAKGETIDEVPGWSRRCTPSRRPLSVPGRLLDVVGTGGDRSMSVNISTMAAIVAAGAGAQVVKHGNRSASSKSGSADVLEAARHPARPAGRAGRRGRRRGRHHLLLRGDLPPGDAARRRARGASSASRTTFNLLGPLTNPARAGAQAIGCADPRHGAGDGRRVRRPRRRRLGLPRRRRPRRADHDHDLPGLAGARRRGHRARRSTRADLGIAARHHRGAARWRRRAQRRRRTPAARRRARPGARRRAAQRGRRARGATTPRASRWTRRWRPGWPGPPTRSTPAPPGRRSTAGCAAPSRSSAAPDRRWPLRRRGRTRRRRGGSRAGRSRRRPCAAA